MKKQEPRSKAVNVEAVAQIGLATSYAKAPLFEGRTLGPQGPANKLTVHKSGSQHGLAPARSMPEGDILSEYGPESDNQMD